MNNSKSLYPSLEEFMIQEQINSDYHQSKSISKSISKSDLDSDIQKVENKYNNFNNFNNLILANPEIYYKTKKNEGIYMIQFRKNQGILLNFQVYKLGVFISNLNKISSDIGFHLGDQLINLNGLTLSGLKREKVEEYYNRFDNTQLLTFMVRDRPYSKVITLTKSPTDNKLGFLIKKGYITDLVENTSAHRNGLLVDHKLVEIDGHQTYNLSDNEIIKMLMNTQYISVNLTIYPREFYEKLTKKGWW